MTLEQVRLNRRNDNMFAVVDGNSQVCGLFGTKSAALRSILANGMSDYADVVRIGQEYV